MKKITIYVIGHDEESIKMAKKDDLYTPLFVGAQEQGTFGFLGDNTGLNISNKNDHYCEMTGFYWMCKNSNSEIIGLNHYRRYFSKYNFFGHILNKKDIKSILESYDIIIARLNKNLGSLSTYEIAEYFFEEEGSGNMGRLYDLTREIIKKSCPEYLSSFDEVIYSINYKSCFNMFVANKKLMNDYCNWIFPILYSLEKQIDLNTTPRVMGYLCERYFLVWIKQKKLRVYESNYKIIGFKLNIRRFILEFPIFRYIYNFLMPFKKKHNKHL